MGFLYGVAGRFSLLRPPLRHVFEFLQFCGRYVFREVGAVDGIVLEQRLCAERGEFARGGFEERRAGDGGEFRKFRDAAVVPDEVYRIFLRTKYSSHNDSFLVTRRSSSRTSISAKPRRFCPRHFNGLTASGASACIRMPHIPSYGLASANIASPVDRRNVFSSIF